MTTTDTPTLDLDTQIFESQFREEHLRRKENALREASYLAADAGRDLSEAVEKLGGSIACLAEALKESRWHDAHEDEIHRILHIARCNLCLLMQRHADIQKDVAEAIAPAEEAVHEALAEQNRKTGQLMETRNAPAATPQSSIVNCQS